ncbi:MAG: M17 family peptidase N-terminal domain-containing protein, partial [Sphingopyxis sp.]
MIVEFVDGGAADRDVLVVPVTTGGLADATALLPESFRPLAATATQQARFDGAAGAVFETFVAQGAVVRRLLLVGAGAGDAAGYERAGAGLTARLIASGATAVYADLTGVAADCAARFALGAVLRGWRMDRYRTRLPAKQKATLDRIAIGGAAAGSEAAWAQLRAVAEGVAFTRELVAEPGNIIYPQSFVDRCSALADAGITIDVLDEAAMTDLGMGAIVGVGQGSARPPRLLCMEWKGAGAPDGAPLL